MAKQLKERIQVGIDKDGNPIYKWATGYSKQDLFLSIAALLNSPEEKTFVTLLLALILLFACAAAVAEYDTHEPLPGTA